MAGGGCFTGMMAFPFFFPFGVHVQFMETFYVCVYIKTISLHKVIYTKLFICFKAEVYSKEQNLHHCFFSKHPFILYCITDIGAHKPRLLAPFAMYDSLMYYISNSTNNDELLRMKFCILYVMHGNKIYSLSLSLSKHLEHCELINTCRLWWRHNTSIFRSYSFKLGNFKLISAINTSIKYFPWNFYRVNTTTPH